MPPLTPVAPPDAGVYVRARQLSDGQAKPLGALGRLEELGAWVASCQGECPPRSLGLVWVQVFAGDHGVTEHGVSAYPAALTPAIVKAMVNGDAGVAVLARALSVPARLDVADLGVAADDPELPERVTRFKVGPSRPFHLADALRVADAERALAAGDQLAAEAAAARADLVVVGDVGIGNTTPSAALIAATYGVGAREVTGRGTGIDDQTFARKIAIIDAGLRRVGARASDPLQRLAALGSADIAAGAGFMIGAARRGVPILLDGVIAVAEAAVAESLAPGASAWMRAGHRSTEPGCSFGLSRLGLEPLLDLQLRLGEGTGAVMAVPIVHAAVEALRGIAQLADLAG